MPQETKFIKGKPFTSLDILSEWLDAGNWAYFNHKVMHPGFLVSMSFRTITLALSSRRISYAFVRKSLSQEQIKELTC
jgi:hypothetical protein